MTSTTDAELWAFNFTANAIRDKIAFANESLDTIAYTYFDHDIAAPSGNVIHITDPDDQRPQVTIEKSGDDQYQIVISWDGDEKHRSTLQPELLPAVKRFLP